MEFGLDINFKCWYVEDISNKQMRITKNMFLFSKPFVDFEWMFISNLDT